jgi:hypothetical protein
MTLDGKALSGDLIHLDPAEPGDHELRVQLGAQHALLRPRRSG